MLTMATSGIKGLKVVEYMQSDFAWKDMQSDFASTKSKNDENISHRLIKVEII